MVALPGRHTIRSGMSGYPGDEEGTGIRAASDKNKGLQSLVLPAHPALRTTTTVAAWSRRVRDILMKNGYGHLIALATKSMPDLTASERQQLSALARPPEDEQPRQEQGQDRGYKGSQDGGTSVPRRRTTGRSAQAKRPSLHSNSVLFLEHFTARSPPRASATSGGQGS